MTAPPAKPRPKAPSATEAFAEIRRRRDEIAKSEGLKPRDPPPIADYVENGFLLAGFDYSALFVAARGFGKRVPEDLDELYRLYGQHGLDLSEGAE